MKTLKKIVNLALIAIFMPCNIMAMDNDNLPGMPIPQTPRLTSLGQKKGRMRALSLSSEPVIASAFIDANNTLVPSGKHRVSHNSKKGHMRALSLSSNSVIASAIIDVNITRVPSRKNSLHSTNNSVEMLEQLDSLEQLNSPHSAKTLRPSQRQINLESARVNAHVIGQDNSTQAVIVNAFTELANPIRRRNNSQSLSLRNRSVIDLAKIGADELSRSSRYISSLRASESAQNPGMVTLNGVERPLPQITACCQCAIQ